MTDTATDTKAKKNVAAPSAETVTPTVLAVRVDLVPPVTTSRVGRSSLYVFDALEVNHSIGVIGKTAEELYASVNTANRKYKQPKVDANGAIVYKNNKITDPATGAVTLVPSNKPELVSGRVYKAFDTDPATDPDKATARIFRIA